MSGKRLDPDGWIATGIFVLAALAPVGILALAALDMAGLL